MRKGKGLREGKRTKRRRLDWMKGSEREREERMEMSKIYKSKNGWENGKKKGRVELSRVKVKRERLGK